MSKNFREIATEIGTDSGALAAGLPDLMSAFSAMGKAAYSNGALDAKTKELIALAIGITVRCDGCISYHTKRVCELGATRAEVVEAIGVAIHMGGGPSMVYGGEALRAFDTFHLKEAA